MNSVYFMTECQILWGTQQLQTFSLSKARHYLLTHITNKCWYLFYPTLSDDPFELIMMLWTRAKSLAPVKRQRCSLAQIFKPSSSSSKTWSAGKKVKQMAVGWIKANALGYTLFLRDALRTKMSAGTSSQW